MSDWRNEYLMRAAAVEVKLMTEFLAPLDVRPSWRDATWVANAPCGPSLAGVRALRRAQIRYGAANVTTGNAAPGSVGDVLGIYVRPDVLRRSRNPLRDHLSHS